MQFKTMPVLHQFVSSAGNSMGLEALPGVLGVTGGAWVSVVLESPGVPIALPKWVGQSAAGWIYPVR